MKRRIMAVLTAGFIRSKTRKKGDAIESLWMHLMKRITDNILRT